MGAGGARATEKCLLRDSRSKAPQCPRSAASAPTTSPQSAPSPSLRRLTCRGGRSAPRPPRGLPPWYAPAQPGRGPEAARGASAHAPPRGGWGERGPRPFAAPRVTSRGAPASARLRAVRGSGRRSRRRRRGKGWCGCRAPAGGALRGGGEAQGHPLRLDSGSALRLRASSPSPEEPGREAGRGLGAGDTRISLEPASPPHPVCRSRLPGVPFHQPVASCLGKGAPPGRRGRVSERGPATPL